MKALIARAALPVLAAMLYAAPQSHPLSPANPPPDRDGKLPDGRSQQEEILKADHQRDLRDVAQLIALAQDLQKELEKNDRHVLSIASIKKTEEIEKIAKRIRGRIVR